MGTEVSKERVRHYTDEDGIRRICQSRWFFQRPQIRASDTGAGGAGVYVTPPSVSPTVFETVALFPNNGNTDFYVEFDMHLQGNAKHVRNNVWLIACEYLTLNGLNKKGTVVIGSTQCSMIIQDPARVEDLIKATKQQNKGLMVKLVEKITGWTLEDLREQLQLKLALCLLAAVLMLFWKQVWPLVAIVFIFSSRGLPALREQWSDLVRN